MEWIDIKVKRPDAQKEEGWYVVLIAHNPHIVYLSHRNWQGDWHIPDEWKEPTHYIKLENIKDFWSNSKSHVTMG